MLSPKRNDATNIASDVGNDYTLHTRDEQHIGRLKDQVSNIPVGDIEICIMDMFRRMLMHFVWEILAFKARRAASSFTMWRPAVFGGICVGYYSILSIHSGRARFARVSPSQTSGVNAQTLGNSHEGDQ